MNATLFFPTGDHYWEILENQIAEGYPRPISEDWVSLEGDLDAAVTFPTGDTYIFKVIIKCTGWLKK